MGEYVLFCMLHVHTYIEKAMVVSVIIFAFFCCCCCLCEIVHFSSSVSQFTRTFIMHEISVGHLWAKTYFSSFLRFLDPHLQYHAWKQDIFIRFVNMMVFWFDYMNRLYSSTFRFFPISVSDLNNHSHFSSKAYVLYLYSLFSLSFAYV